MSLASFRYGSDYLSIGRVQTPTLRLVVDRELERRAFVPVPYWEIKAELEAGSGERFTVDHANGRFAPSPKPARRSPAPRPTPPRSRPMQRRRAPWRRPAPFQHDGPDERRFGRRA